MKLLVIRPQPGADATAARIRSAGHEPIVMPLFEVQSIAWDLPSANQCDALLLTSGNAVRSAGEGLDALRGLPVFAVGSATARAVQTAGLPKAVVGESNVAELLDTAIDAGHRRLLWLAGQDRIAVLAPDGMMLDIRTVYRSAALPAPEDFADHVRSADAVLLHSPRAARHFAALCDDQTVDRAEATLGALSPSIAENAGQGWKALITAAEPNDAALLSQLQTCFSRGDSDPRISFPE